MDLRLAEKDFELDGKVYKLHGNFNVLADVQEAYDGDFTKALRGTVKSYMVFLAAFLNDACEDAGYEERFTARQLGRKFTTTSELKLVKDTVNPLIAAMLPKKQGTATEEKRKNV